MIRAKRLTLALAVVLGCGIAPFATAQSQTATDLPQQSLAQSLRSLGSQTGTSMLFDPSLVEGRRAPALDAGLTLDEALHKVLSGTGLTYRFIDDKTVAVTAISDKTPSRQAVGKSDKPVVSLDEIVVTGSRIATNASQLAAHVLRLTAEDLEVTGENTLEGALAQLPQNIYGTSPTGAAVPGATNFNGAQNITGGSTINLRGLGSAASLVLVNGHRIGKSGVFGGASDITGIPLSAVEEVQIMLDGASSIYGSDAVGGVVNIILKNNFQGNSIAVEGGFPDQGGFQETTVNLAKGFDWETGHLGAFYEYFDRTNLEAADRPDFITNTRFGSPASVRGGPLFYVYQGRNLSIAQLRTEFGLVNPTAAQLAARGITLIRDSILPLGDGNNLNVNQFVPIPTLGSIANSPWANSNETGVGISLLPAQRRHSLQLVLTEKLSDKFTVNATAYYSNRLTHAESGPFDFTSPIPASNPRNPFGTEITTSWRISSLPNRYYETKQEVARWNVELVGDLGRGWTWSYAGGQNVDNIDSKFYNTQIQTVGVVGSPATLYNSLLAQGLNLLAGDIVAANPAELLAQLVRPEALPIEARNEETFLKTYVAGNLFKLPGGHVRLAAGAEWRKETLDTFSATPVSATGFGSGANASTPDTRFGYDRVAVERVQKSGYLESIIPLVGEENEIPVVRELTLTAAGRYDSYENIGSDTTWSAGLIWKPISSLAVKVNDSSSFVVPTPKEALSPTRYTYYAPDVIIPYLPIVDTQGNPTGQFVNLGGSISGGNPDLEPETARGLTAGLQWNPQFVSGLALGVTWYRTEYSNRIGSAAPLVFVQGQDWDSIPRVQFDDYGRLIEDVRAGNAASLTVSGYDYQVLYDLDSDWGRWTATANVSYLQKADLVNLPGQAPVNQVDTVTVQSTQVLPKYRYAASLAWRKNGISVSLSSTTTSETTSTGSDRNIGLITRNTKPALITNLVANYDLSRSPFFESKWLKSSTVSFRVLNLFADRPTYVKTAALYPDLNIAELNAVSADPRGRMFYLGFRTSF